MTRPTTIYLVRHGQTQWNVNEILQGQVDSPLTEEGLHQAHLLGEQFQKIKFQAIYSSDIGRAKATAEIIAQYHHLPVHTTRLIRERAFGKFQGQPASKVDELLRPRLEMANELSKDRRFVLRLAPGIETDEEMMHRLYQFFSRVHYKHPGQTILSVAHGALMRVFLFYLDFARYGQLDFHSIDNLGYMVIKTDGSKVDLIKTHGIHLHQTGFGNERA